MKKFKFTLQTVHNVREMKMERENVILGSLRAEAKKADAEVAELEKRRTEALDNYTQKLVSGQPLNPMEMELNANHFASLNRLQKEAENLAEQRKQECRQQSEIVAGAMREVKVTERLRETQAERFQNEVERQEQNITDELISAGFARRLTQTK